MVISLFMQEFGVINRASVCLRGPVGSSGVKVRRADPANDMEVQETVQV